MPSRPKKKSAVKPTRAHYIWFETCDEQRYWVWGSCFDRKLVSEDLNTSGSKVPLKNYQGHKIPFNNELGGRGGPHLSYFVHAHSDEDTNPKTCIWYAGDPVVQLPVDRKANVFNSLYWQRCDGTVRNALEEVLTSNLVVRLRDVIEPRLAGGPTAEDMAKFDRWKNTFITRFR